MTLIAFTIPEDPARVPGWLELRLVSPDFGRFVAELCAMHPDRSRAQLPARQLMGDSYRRALTEGLSNIPIGVLHQLLRHPRCLLELQEAVLTEGGPYWDDVLERTEEHTPLFDRGQASLGKVLTGTPSRPNTREGETPAEPAAPARDEPRHAGTRNYFTWAMVSSALAACLLVAVGFLTLGGNKPTEMAAANWGWAKPGGIPRDGVKPTEYLNGLADTANEWFDKRPETAADVARRIGELRTGCSQLILAPHTPLAATDKQWLVERCQKWAENLDRHLTALEAGGDPVKIRGAADDTVRQLQTALRDRARQVG